MLYPRFWPPTLVSLSGLGKSLEMPVTASKCASLSGLGFNQNEQLHSP